MSGRDKLLPLRQAPGFSSVVHPSAGSCCDWKIFTSWDWSVRGMVLSGSVVTDGTEEGGIAAGGDEINLTERGLNLPLDPILSRWRSGGKAAADAVPRYAVDDRDFSNAFGISDR
jgi:hypothetical protein